MTTESRYSISTKVEFPPLQVIDIPKLKVGIALVISLNETILSLKE